MDSRAKGADLDQPFQKAVPTGAALVHHPSLTRAHANSPTSNGLTCALLWSAFERADVMAAR